MDNVLLLLTIIISILLVVLILIQGKGAGLGSAWGGSGEMYQTRRGVEKITLRFTVILIIAFFVISLIKLFLTAMSFLQRKTLRYYYWLVKEFVKKHSKMILLSFFLSFFIVIAMISFSPILNKFLFTKRDVIGMVGDYDTNSLPDEVLEKISHGLVFINQKGDVLPALATSWEMMDKGKEFRFHLKNELFWDDGKKFKAKDLTYNFTDVEIKDFDDTTLEFKLKKALPIFPTYLIKPVVRYPFHGVAGLYKVDKVKTRQGFIREVDLSPNKEGLPLVIYKFYDSESKMISAYKSGSINRMEIVKKKY